MAATGYTPISLYYSTTTSNVPVNTNLVNGELAINITDGKLFYKDNTGTVQTIATKNSAGGTFTQVNITGNGELRLQDTAGGEYVALKSPATLGASYTLTMPADDGAASQVLTTDGSGTLSWTTPASTGGGFTATSIISGNTNAANQTLYVFTASLTLTLPASPSVGNYVGVSNLSGTTTCVIGRNGNNIMSSATDMTVDVLSAGFTLYYTGATQGWVIL